ncbi:endonuclease V [Halomicrobium katesii]|uniref:endonuclease V n=1 Tax=Halomicrobium katesii TaxID=437163 RepID=UPI00036854A5|nr:endonuclease V [Halomicrobium katesii]
MEPARPEFVPDPALSRGEMESLQREIAAEATFADDLGVDPAALRSDPEQHRPGEDVGDGSDSAPAQPLVAGVDQAFVDDVAVSAVVVSRGDEVVERVHAAVETEIPYIPGLLSFREGGAILAALGKLRRTPDLLVVDGSGRIHFREAGLATHVGVLFDVPAIGVAKSLLCGEPRESLDGKLSVGTTVEIEADDSVETATPGALIGHAVQTRQYDSPKRHVNPLYVSPGHRVGAATVPEIVLATTAGYKLPEPTRLADSDADEAKAAVRERRT